MPKSISKVISLETYCANAKIPQVRLLVYRHVAGTNLAITDRRCLGDFSTVNNPADQYRLGATCTMSSHDLQFDQHSNVKGVRQMRYNTKTLGPR